MPSRMLSVFLRACAVAPAVVNLSFAVKPPNAHLVIIRTTSRVWDFPHGSSITAFAVQQNASICFDKKKRLAPRLHSWQLKRESTGCCSRTTRHWIQYQNVSSRSHEAFQRKCRPQPTPISRSHSHHICRDAPTRTEERQSTVLYVVQHILNTDILKRRVRPAAVTQFFGAQHVVCRFVQKPNKVLMIVISSAALNDSTQKET